MSHSNQKKIKTSKEYLINPQFYSQDDFYELKSEFFETYQKNDLKLLSDGIFIFEFFN